VAQAADRLGFGGVLIPTGRSCEDAWLVAASLIPEEHPVARQLFRIAAGHQIKQRATVG
jgi:hypothetical protein